MRTKVTQTSTEMAEVTLLDNADRPTVRVEVSIDSLPSVHALTHHAAKLGGLDYTPGELESFPVRRPDRFREAPDSTTSR